MSNELKRSVVVSGIIFNPVMWGLLHKPRDKSHLNNQDSTESIWVFFCFFVAHIVSILFRSFTMLDFNLDWFGSINWWKGGCTPFPVVVGKSWPVLCFVPQQGCTNDGETDPTYHEWSLRILSFQNMQEYYTWRILVHSQKGDDWGLQRGLEVWNKRPTPKKWYQQQCPGFCSFKSHLRTLGWVYAIVEDSRNTCESKPVASTNQGSGMGKKEPPQNIHKKNTLKRYLEDYRSCKIRG